MKLSTAPLALLFALPLQAQDDAPPPPLNTSGGALLDEQACFDVLSYGIALEIDPEARQIDGTLTMDATLLERSREIALHLDPALQVKAVRLGTPERVTPASFERQGGLFFVDASRLGSFEGAIFRVEVDYGGIPHVATNPPWDGGFTWSESDGKPWFVTSCQGEGADLWWPCKDHPSDKPERVDLSFTVPAGLVVATNGRHLGDEVSEDGTHVTSSWQVTTPISNYAVALNVGPYTTVTRDFESVAGDTFPVTFWMLEESAEKGAAFMDEIVDHLAFFERYCGPYPFRGDKYGVVETPHLGMEHQSIIAYGNRFRGDPNFDYDWLHHHELAHEWWGNLVTAKDWADFWILRRDGRLVQHAHQVDLHL
ncbi:MAG: M1 family peptidase, partial [Planctomycetota bacterium]